ncbi:MAG: PEGA domain-containing protein [Verrucomicrobia bacterium]|nr:PEGA domain-containing protein [Verrucomicrobiota bacterium]
MNCTIKLATIALAVVCTGCGTTKETLFINSDPTGARVTLSNGMGGATPCSFIVPLKEKTVVTIEKDGFEPAQVTVAKKVSKNMVAGRAVAAVLVAPIVAVGGSGGGGVIGPVSKLEPNPVSVKLLPLPKNLPPQKSRAD